MTQLTTVVREQIEELMNSYLHLKSSGLDLSFEAPLDQVEVNQEGYELVEGEEKKEDLKGRK